MKGVLVAGIIAALSVSAVESLNCMQCNSLANSCVDSTITECPSEANTSCTSFLTLGSITLYQDKACSAENCSEERNVFEAFTVHVSDGESFYFASQCCQGRECNDTNDASVPPLENTSSNVECPACYGSNETSCSVKLRRCYNEERCVSLVAEFKNDLKTPKLVLKGCSNIDNSTCQFLSAENRTVGGVTFQNFECVDTSNSPSTPNSTEPPQTTTRNTGFKVSFTPTALASLLLLGLLL
ncbi:PREDICTED: ly6/PLAUR domain-containing protein 8 [Ceratotherium simum simum]|uniref:Ly6/PLAUR domain-containing protein 8 n=1 Tax=Ceratotherium simum simum TaxID=73337 RepID=A0ABM0HAP3_CERSS|nr:PREDICTED: ly6/PLAUR domain-containing protein 8 [Ceratotherium simum simum]